MYSQNDPAYRAIRLGASKLLIPGYGCFLMSLANLYQRDPLDLLKVPGGINSSGLLLSSVLAKACGGEALPRTTVPPKGWCIACTNAYAPDFPTHFFCVNMDTHQQIDPLDYPANIEPLSYTIVEYRPFTNVKLTDTEPWQKKVEKWSVENGVIGSGWDAPDAPMSQVRIAAALKNFKERFIH